MTDCMAESCVAQWEPGDRPPTVSRTCVGDLLHEYSSTRIQLLHPAALGPLDGRFRMRHPASLHVRPLLRFTRWAVAASCVVAVVGCSDDDDDDDGLVGPPGSTELPTQEALRAAL